jgi:choline kinase
MGRETSTPSVTSFSLDTRVPANYSYVDDEKAHEAETKRKIETLIHETRIWRVANSAQWVAWGIVQAKVAGMDEALDQLRAEKAKLEKDNESRDLGDNQRTLDRIESEEVAIKAEEEQTPHPPHEHEMDDEEAFDYLAYAQDRAMFFWGDLLELGLVKDDELPKEVVFAAKRLKY